MARRALVAGDVVAAVERHQQHFADRLGNKREAIGLGALLPHEQYVVVLAYRKGEAKTSPKRLLVGLPGDDGMLAGDDVASQRGALPRVSVSPSAVRLWSNQQERRRRRLAGGD